MSSVAFVTGPERDTQEKVWTALDKATKSSQPLCVKPSVKKFFRKELEANSQGKKKPAPPVSSVLKLPKSKKNDASPFFLA